jgi:hypothetical protein
MMALINILKIATDGLQAEHDPAADSINMLDYSLGSVSLAGTSGSTALGDDSSTYTNISPAGDTIREALEAIDTFLGSVEASKVCNTYTATSALGIGDAVYVDGANSVDLAQSDVDSDDNPVGVAGEAISAAASGQICSEGVVVGALTGATPGAKYFLTPTGTTGNTLSTTVPGGGNNIVLMGFAKNATDLHLQIQNVGKKI